MTQPTAKRRPARARAAYATWRARPAHRDHTTSPRDRIPPAARAGIPSATRFPATAAPGAVRTAA
ncbi:hypothetical protein [Streptomyces rimosus]|uniref:hypothetical protein n=1 Tax=Streptomyces rimosus TaxID=1927 RepID=UPI0004CC6C85|nr:hypothetical protein [Streptomyces rimosus]